ncbi:ArsR/SmtB family transcription factor [Sphingomonas sp. MMS12-HWE2-04]|uniref:ArsR/SmtB family transcription factor n=1 Tax=Sphingomonas sp. MMS12-HWE2-04 TaxID=3234199 RepID=UPI0038502C2E
MFKQPLPRSARAGIVSSLAAKTRTPVKQASTDRLRETGPTRANPPFSNPTERLDNAAFGLLANQTVGARHASDFRHALQHEQRRVRMRPRDTQTLERVNQASTGMPPKSGETLSNPPFPSLTTRLDPAAADALANLMVGQRLDATLRALADPTRREMLARLARGAASLAELTRGFAMSGTGAAKHLHVLEVAGLVRRQGSGRRQCCVLAADPLVEAMLWMRRWVGFAGPHHLRTAALLDAAAGLPAARPLAAGRRLPD